MWIADPWDENLREAKAVGLDSREVRCARSRKIGVQRARRQFTKVILAAEVHGEIGIDSQGVHISAEFDAVPALYPGEGVAHLVALLHPLYERKRLTANEGESGDVDGYVAASRSPGKTVEQPAARVLVPGFVGPVVAHDPGVMDSGAAIVIVLRGSA